MLGPIGGGLTTIVGNFTANAQDTHLAVLGSSAGQPTFPGLWLGAITPSLTNFALVYNQTSNVMILGVPTAGTIALDPANSGSPPFQVSAAAIGFYAHAPAAKQTVTGAKGSNAALASLMTALVAIGLVTDSTSA